MTGDPWNPANWEAEQARRREIERFNAVERDTTLEVHTRAQAAGYSDTDTAILSPAIGKLARRNAR